MARRSCSSTASRRPTPCGTASRPVLAERFTTVVVDLRGYGRSDAPARRRRPHRVLQACRWATTCAWSWSTSVTTATPSSATIVGARAGLPHGARHARARGPGRSAGHPADGRVLGPAQPDVRRGHLPLDVPRPTGTVPRDAHRWCPAVLLRPLPGELVAGRPARPVFDSVAVEHYRAMFTEPARIAAMRADYRAGATVDLEMDRADRAAGRRVRQPCSTSTGTPGSRRRGPHRRVAGLGADARSAPVDSGHFVAEENAPATLAALSAFLAAPDDRIAPIRRGVRHHSPRCSASLVVATALPAARPGPPRHGRSTAGAGGRQHEAAEGHAFRGRAGRCACRPCSSDSSQKRKATQRRRHERQSQDGCRRARQDPGRQRHTRHDLDAAVDGDEALRRQPGRRAEGTDQRLGGVDPGRRVPEGVDPAVDEDPGEQRTSERFGDGHGRSSTPWRPTGVLVGRPPASPPRVVSIWARIVPNRAGASVPDPGRNAPRSPGRSSHAECHTNGSPN